jgi:hypothetical protein
MAATVTPNWRNEFPPEGPANSDPIVDKQRYCQLLDMELRQTLERLMAAATAPMTEADLKTPEGEGKNKVTLGELKLRQLQIGIAAVERAVGALRETKKRLGIETKEARGGDAAGSVAAAKMKAVLEQYAGAHA